MFAPDTKILVIDDMLMARMLVKKSLKELGFSNFQEACDGKEALKMITESGDYQLIISDWNMPNMTGIELLKNLRSQEKYANLPFIMLTAEGEEKQIKEAFQAGVNGYITKPFNHDIFQAKLEFAHRKILAAA